LPINFASDLYGRAIARISWICSTVVDYHHEQKENAMNRLDRCRGALIGLAVGDALGAAVEFMDPGTFPPVTGYRSGGPHGLNAGEWTDDTSMALALADSIKTVGWDLNDQAERYVQWMKHGKFSVNGRCFDIGITTSRALHTFMESKDATQSGSRSESASGNGSIMRLAPVPIRYHGLFPNHITELSRLAEESSLTTHASEQCLSACRYMATVLSGLIYGEDRNKVLSASWELLAELNANKPLHPLVLAVANGSFRDKAPPAIRGSGWVVESLEAALWAFDNAESFEAAVLKAVNLGFDTDTTGAVCGQLAGALWGESGIPASLHQGLARYDMLNEALDGLVLNDGQP
jgi:ADP-ribosylglycohydrolase